jgi:hypothetical protein
MLQVDRQPPGTSFACIHAPIASSQIPDVIGYVSARPAELTRVSIGAVLGYALGAGLGEHYTSIGTGSRRIANTFL